MSYTLLIVTIGTFILGLVSGALGCFALLRKQSLLGDAISHAALPGIALAFMITQTKSPIILALGALAAGWLGTYLVTLIVEHTIIKQDAALGIVLSVFFGFGLVLLTKIQKHASAAQSGLDTYLFGSASTLLKSDVMVMCVLGALTLLTLIIFWKEFKLLSFDAPFLHSLGFPSKKLDLGLVSLICVSIVIGLQTVGVVLMSAMIIAPAAAARQWTDRLSLMVFLASIFGAVSGVSGAYLSSIFTHLPTGPTIVLAMGFLVLLSLLFAPHRGLIWGAFRHYHHHQNIRTQQMLANLLLFSESQTDPHYAHDIAALTAIGRGPAKKALASLKAQGLVKNPELNKWAITPKGLDEARSHYKKLFGASA